MTPNTIGIIRSGKFHAKSDFGIKLKYFVEAREETGFVAEVISFIWESEVKNYSNVQCNNIMIYILIEIASLPLIWFTRKVISSINSTEVEVEEWPSP